VVKDGEQELKDKVQLFDFSAETWESIKRNTPLLAHVAKERIKEELCKPFQK
jgi:tRNA nucleotidyltransferase/poly(A) polymerase